MSPQEVQAAVEAALPGWMRGSGPIWSLLFIVMAAGVASWAGSYLREKGRNVATKEDLHEITKKVEDVKAEIGRNLWIHQERWKLKRDLYLRLLGALGEAGSTLDFLQQRAAASEPPVSLEKQQIDPWLQERIERATTAMDDLQQTTRIAGVILDARALEALNFFTEEMRKARAPGIPPVGPEAVTIMLGAFRTAQSLVEEAANRDLWK